MKKKKWVGPLLFAVFLAGLSLLLYPSFSDHWNATRQSRAIASYAEEVATLDPELKESLWLEAEQYNASLLERSNPYTISEDQREIYASTLKTSAQSAMAYIEIPSIQVLLPVYHGTSEQVLQHAIGHLDWTSVPVGGANTHCVISGHRGLPSAKLFTDLAKLVMGDIFMLQVLDETLTYEVDQILTVKPEDVAALAVEEGKDYCTLVTCTPYGINTHRLLVRGHRIENLEAAKTIRIVSEAMQIEPMIVAPVVAIPLLVLLLVLYMIDDSLRKRRR